MARNKKARKEDIYDDLYCTVDGWQRDYRFGINRHKWELNNDVYDDWDRITIKERSTTTSRTEGLIAGRFSSRRPDSQTSKLPLGVIS